MIRTFLFILLINSYTLAQVDMIHSSKVSDQALYFAGEKGIDYHFNSRITPHGDCIKVAFGYIYVTWYRGGMDNRHVMLSRKKIGEEKWHHIEFPHQHTGYRGNPKKGDSHNTIAIGISPLDSTIHLIYDMHAYSETQYGVDFFNYSLSKTGAAVAEDEDWTIDLFNRKRNYLKKDQDYDKATYPNFSLADDGKLFVFWRLGGSGNGNHSYAYYDQNGWSETIQFNNGNQTTVSEKYSIYGSFAHYNNRLMTGFAIRYRDFPNEKYTYNSGLYFASSIDPTGASQWQTLQGKPVTLPIQSPQALKIGSPLELVNRNYMSSGATWVVTPNESYHFLSTVNDTTIHYYKSSGEKSIRFDIGSPKGKLFSIGHKVYLMGLNDIGQPFLLSTPEGKNEWREEYSYEGDLKFRHGNSTIHENRIYYYLMQNDQGDAQPIHVLEFIVN
ncbi:BNR-4 repeat-containing protein [Portibacter marinus]|uniref:BNR-4 repeat-containing protein n=1 Tax=Portibacter marinus TaxID=2898660 RepID=UPI001F44054E|nr:BNR-4 repeat-containing protein [Portibacter marinus]